MKRSRVKRKLGLRFWRDELMCEQEMMQSHVEVTFLSQSRAYFGWRDFIPPVLPAANVSVSSAKIWFLTMKISMCSPAAGREGRSGIRSITSLLLFYSNWFYIQASQQSWRFFRFSPSYLLEQLRTPLLSTLIGNARQQSQQQPVLLSSFSTWSKASKKPL